MCFRSKLLGYDFYLNLQSRSLSKYLINTSAGSAHSEGMQKTGKCLFAIIKVEKVHKVQLCVGKIQTESRQWCQNSDFKLQEIKCPVC